MAIAPLGFSVDTSQVQKATGDLSTMTAATGKAAVATTALSASTKGAASSTGQLGQAAANAAGQMQVLAANTNAQQQQMRNLAFQFQDIGTMLAAGQSPFMLLAQQLPQITMYGGRLTGVMGALKQTVAGLISPLGLITTGFVVAASMAISYFSDAGDEAEKLKEELAEQEDMIKRVADRWGEAVPEIRDYANEIERLIDLSDLQAATALTVEKAYEQTNIAFEKFLDAFYQAGFEDSGVVTLTGDVSNLQDAMEDLAEAQKTGADSTKQFEAVQRLLNSIISNEALPATGELRDRVNELAIAYTVAAEKAGDAAERFRLINSRGGVGIDESPGPGRGGDPRGSFEDEGGYWEDRFFPDPERAARPARAPRKPRKTDAERAADNYKEMIRESQQFIQAQQLEAQALGMTEEAASRLRYEQELLNKAANDNIQLTPEMTAELKNYAAQMSAAEIQTARLKEQVDFADDVTRGFLDDIAQSLRSGEDLWKSFADAAINALDRLLDKLLEVGTDQLLAGLFGNLLGGASSFGTVGGFADMLGMAKGGAFSGGNVIPFARGGVVGGPTLFPFAKGVGLMGEAGPEGIMPLRRDSQGNLGVIASGGGGVQQVQVDVGVSVDDDGKIQAYVIRTSQQTTAQGIKEYDKTSAARLPRDAKQVRARMGSV